MAEPRDTPDPTRPVSDQDALERQPDPGQMPSDADVQAERQEEGVEAEHDGE